MIDNSCNKEKEFYNKIGKIIGWDFSSIKYEVVDKPPKYEKDYNDYLCKFLNKNKQKNRTERER